MCKGKVTSPGEPSQDERTAEGEDQGASTSTSIDLRRKENQSTIGNSIQHPDGAAEIVVTLSIVAACQPAEEYTVRATRYHLVERETSCHRPVACQSTTCNEVQPLALPTHDQLFRVDHTA